MRRTRILLASLLLLLCACRPSATRSVDPFVGTGGHGHTFPAAIVPFGMLQPGPDTRLEGWDACSGYHVTDDTIYGFSHTHLSGTGVLDYGDILVVPFADSVATRPEAYRSAFRHKNEKASPGYYRVILDRSHIMAELTTSERVAYHRYTFPHRGTKGILVDLSHRDAVLSSSLSFDGETLTGYRRSNSWNPDQHCYFALQSSQPVVRIAYFRGDTEVETPPDGTDCKAVLYFAPDVNQVELRVAISAVDVEGARANLDSEPRRPFNEARKAASRTWQRALGAIEVQGGTADDRRNFYTALYHCMTAPYLFSDADGRYRGTDGAIHRTDGRHNVYTVFSLWDTYRALHPLLTLLDRRRTEDFLYTFARHYEQGGELTMWELCGHETHCMIGYHSAPVILDAFRAGIFDQLDDSTQRLLLDGLVATSNRTAAHRSYAASGYVASEEDNESVSKTLEYAYDDWCIAQLAQALSDTALHDIYRRRAQSWQNVMDDEGFMHARRNGGFVSPFDPREVNNHFTEANSWQYSTYVPHDVAGWVARQGGPEAAEAFLDSLFGTTAPLTGRDQSDITGLIGQYAHGNEPSHHAAYLYAYVGKQDKTAEMVRRIATTLYSPRADGLCGNEDCGQMSAWLVLSDMGFYPVCPGSGTYVIGSPLFDRVVLHVDGSEQPVVISCRNQRRDRPFIRQLRIDGQESSRAYLTYETLSQGCQLDIEMDGTPCNRLTEVPPTPQAGIAEPPTPFFLGCETLFADSHLVSLALPRGVADATIYYTLDGRLPDTGGLRYVAPFVVRHDADIRAVSYRQGRYSPVALQRLRRWSADRTLTYLTTPDPQYVGGGAVDLIDGATGTDNYRIGGYQGWRGDMRVVIDLLQPVALHSATLHCLVDTRSWIFPPTQWTVETSVDGVHFDTAACSATDLADAVERRWQSDDRQLDFRLNAGTEHFSLPLSTTARYVRVAAHNYGPLPPWHVSAGQPAWLFVSEVEVR